MSEKSNLAALLPCLFPGARRRRGQRPAVGLRAAVVLRLAFAAWAAAGAGVSAAQLPDYSQGGDSTNPNMGLIINRLSPPFRIPVRTSTAHPLQLISLRGVRGVHCAFPGQVDADTGILSGVQGEGGGEFLFQYHLLRKLSALDAASIRRSLQRAESAASREQQFQELFGVELPPAERDLPHDSSGRAIKYDRQSQLNLGQEVKLDALVYPSVICLTSAEVDAAIATAKQVHAAVIAAMEGTVRASSAIKPQ